MERNNEVNKENTVAFTRIDDSTIEEKVFDAPTGDVIVEKKQLSWWDKLKIPSIKWIPTSEDTLATAEARMLKGVKTPYQQRMVNIGKDAKGRDTFINTVILGSGPPIVLVHGFSSGVGLWSCNLDELSKFYTVYAIDLLGFGRSSRVPFKGKTPEEGQSYFVDSINAWAEKEKLDKFNLFGHSFGAYIAAHFALKNPEKIEKLILCDPWGVPEKPKEDETQKPPLKWRVIRGLVGSLSKNPIELVRLAGPYGPGLVSKFRPDLVAKFKHIYDDDSVTNYVYHCLAQHPSGEAAFVACSIPLSGTC
jgi:pimeloyl-ACP methyl ester carboxylesterase